MAAAVQTRPTFSAGTPQRLFEDVFVQSPNTFTGYSIAPDGKRFLFPQRLQADPPPTHLNVVVNWFEELKRRVPAK